MKLNADNIDDVVRDGLENGKKVFYWTPEEWKILAEFCVKHGYRFRVERFLGATHEID